jgi:hypothetical protein
MHDNIAWRPIRRVDEVQGKSATDKPHGMMIRISHGEF